MFVIYCKYYSPSNILLVQIPHNEYNFVSYTLYLVQYVLELGNEIFISNKKKVADIKVINACTLSFKCGLHFNGWYVLCQLNCRFPRSTSKS